VTTPIIATAGALSRKRSADNDDDGDHIDGSGDDDDGDINRHAGARTEPRKRTRLSDAARRKSVGFNDVEVREYERRHGGGGGVPVRLVRARVMRRA
jgi:hypothetical protein